MPALRLKCLLRDLRMKRHLSQEELAQQLKVLGLSATHISNRKRIQDNESAAMASLL